MSEVKTDDSILLTIKHMLGGAAENSDHFDTDIKVAINSALMTLHQIGVGPEKGLTVRDETTLWDQLLINGDQLEAAKEYIYIKARLVFDSTSLSSAVMETLKQIAKEDEWRLMVGAEFFTDDANSSEDQRLIDYNTEVYNKPTLDGTLLQGNVEMDLANKDYVDEKVGEIEYGSY